MCLLTALPGGVMPDMADLRNGAEVCQDGYGYAVWIMRGEILTYRSLDAEDALASFEQMRAEYSHGPAAFWSRWTTAGDPGLYNCQPFSVELADGRGVMFHNGTLLDIVDDTAGVGRSDSRVFAEDLMPRNLHHPAVREALKAYLTAVSGKLPNVMAVITAVGDLHIFGEEHGHWVDGAWHSNSDFVPPLEAEDAHHEYAAASLDRDHKELRLLYRRLGAAQLAGDEDAGRLRGAILMARPDIRSGVI